MSDLSGPTLMMAIQAVDAEMRRLKADLAGADPDEQADIQDLLLTNAKAAEELKEAYLRARADASNLPPYSELVGTRS